MAFLKKLPVLTILVVTALVLVFGTKIRTQIEKTAPSLGNLLKDKGV